MMLEACVLQEMRYSTKDVLMDERRLNNCYVPAQQRSQRRSSSRLLLIKPFPLLFLHFQLHT